MNKVKNGILTFHKALNFGAVLQALALCRAIKQLGADAEIINYVNPKMLKEERLMYYPADHSVMERLLYTYRLPARARSIKKFENFNKKHLDLSDALISDGEQLRELRSRYCKIITGSDQVLNYVGTDNDFNFYLEFLDEKRKKVAYAPSFGVQSVDSEHRERVSACLNDFFALSGREIPGIQIMKDLTGREAPLVCDPTFLLSGDDWRKIAVAPKLRKPYVLVYAFGSRHLDTIAKKIADKVGGTVVNINRILPYVLKAGMRNVQSPDPAEFLGLIDNASCVVTNSYHGMALSINLRKDFYVIQNSYTNSEGTNERFKTLAKILSLESRILSTTDPFEVSGIRYEDVYPALDEWRSSSLTYLKQALEL